MRCNALIFFFLGRSKRFQIRCMKSPAPTVHWLRRKHRLKYLAPAAHSAPCWGFVTMFSYARSLAVSMARYALWPEEPVRLFLEALLGLAGLGAVRLYLSTLWALPPGLTWFWPGDIFFVCVCRICVCVSVCPM